MHGRLKHDLLGSWGLLFLPFRLVIFLTKHISLYFRNGYDTGASWEGFMRFWRELLPS